MNDKPYTQAMLKEFDRLTWLASDYNQVKRIDGRLKLNAFIEKHGMDVCEKMYQVLKNPRKGKTYG